MSIGKLCKKELNFINLWDKLTETKKEKKVEMCAECDMLKKELSNYCLPCWNSKMQN